MFENLFAGDYYIIVDVPAAYEVTTQNAGDDAIDSDINAVGQTNVISIVDGEGNNSIDAGLISLCGGFIVTPTPVCDHPIDNMLYVSYGIVGGEAPYTVEGDADFEFGDSILIIEYTIGDTYNVTITDANGCSTTLSEVLVGCDNLAVELLEFDGEMLESGNNLFWRTATEVNNDYFTIERSLDGVNFEAIGNVNSVGNSIAEQRYNLLDTDAPIGKAYYRLAIVDINGTIDYAQNIVILERRATVDFNVYPNPVVNDLTIEFESAIVGANTTITIYDVSGKLITKFNHVNIAGVNKVLLNMKNYAAGTYLLSFINEEQQKAVPVIKH